MIKKGKKNKAQGGSKPRPPKAKVVSSTLAGCTTLILPQFNQVIEIPSGYEVTEGFKFVDLEPKRTLFLRRTNPILFENHLKSRRSKNAAETRRSRSA